MVIGHFGKVRLRDFLKVESDGMSQMVFSGEFQRGGTARKLWHGVRERA